MGRAIDMENDIYALKSRIEKLENTVRGMVSRLDELNEKSSKTKRVNLAEDVGADTEDLGSTITGVHKNEEKETNNKGSSKSSGKSNKRSSNTSKKTNKS